MIEIVAENEQKLKNLRQIGTPAEEDKIYISDTAYRYMHQEDLEDKRVFVLIGHTECSSGKYATFIEDAIRVREIQFEQNVPIWDNKVWKEIFQQVREKYEDQIIVGWALDLKGFPPKESVELEKVHREHFGGAHQMFLMMNSSEGEEYFYININNHLCRKTGFFVYYQVDDKKINTMSEPKIEIELPDDIIPRDTQAGRARARYRNMMKQELQQPADGKSSAAIVIGIAALVVLIGVKVFPMNNISLNLGEAIQTMGNSVRNGSWKHTDTGVEATEYQSEEVTESDADGTDTEQKQDGSQEEFIIHEIDTETVIEMEKISGGLD